MSNILPRLFTEEDIQTTWIFFPTPNLHQKMIIPFSPTYWSKSTQLPSRSIILKKKHLYVITYFFKLSQWAPPGDLLHYHWQSGVPPEPTAPSHLPRTGQPGPACHITEGTGAWAVLLGAGAHILVWEQYDSEQETPGLPRLLQGWLWGELLVDGCLGRQRHCRLPARQGVLGVLADSSLLVLQF